MDEKLRTIMIFPYFENIEIINEIRQKYDPLAELVRPHITIVFPFESDITNDELSGILNNRLSEFSPFNIELRGFSKHRDSSGNYLFLDLTKGADVVRKMHDILYANEFKSYDQWGLDYLPHMTVGKFDTDVEMDEAYETIKNIDAVFTTKVSKVSVEMIGDNEESIIILEKELYLSEL